MRQTEIAIQKTKYHVTDLMLAAELGDLQHIKALVELNDNDINQQNINGVTALMYAIHGGHVEIIKYLLAHGADINLKNIMGKSALILATEKKLWPIVEVLKLH